MKTLKFFFIFLFVITMSSIVFSQGVAINTTGTNAHNTAILDVSSTNKGLLVARSDRSTQLLLFNNFYLS